MKDKYILEIYYLARPTEGRTMFFTSDMPFQAISTGDVINSTMLVEANRANSYIVKSVEHNLWIDESGETKHKVSIITEPRHHDEF